MLGLALALALSLPQALKPIPPRVEACPGATHFYNHISMAKPPAWAKHMKMVCRIGAHTFYAEKHK